MHPFLFCISSAPNSFGERTPWQVFCEDLAGVPVRRYRPEKRVRAFQIDGEWNVDAKPHDIDAPARPVAASEGLRGVGAAVRRELASIEPDWPVFRTVTITTAATGHVVVMPRIDGWSVGPARMLGPDLDAASLHEVVQAALGDADGERDNAPAYKDALAAVGVDPQWLDGGARVALDERSDGTVQVTGEGMAGGNFTEEQTWTGRIEDLAQACAAATEMIPALPTQHLPPGTPTGSTFGYKCRWLAVQRSGLHQVAAAIGLSNSRPVDWEEGVDAAYGGEVFVSPSTKEWVFVVGTDLPFDGLAIAALSERLGTQVQYFGTHRVSETHEWASAVDGRLVRRLFCEGDSGTFKQTGEPTPVEIELGIPATTDDGWRVNEQTVMQIAASWSLDPTTLHLVESTARTGICGT